MLPGSERLRGIPPEGSRSRGKLTYEFIRPPNRRDVFTGDLLHADNRLMIVAAPVSPSKPEQAFGEVVVDEGYFAVWFLYKGESFDVARFYRPDGTWTGYYADVLEPISWEGSDPQSIQPLVDLFLDLWIAPDGRYLILDRNEFEEAITTGALTAAQTDHAQKTLSQLLLETEQGKFPWAEVQDFRL